MADSSTQNEPQRETCWYCHMCVCRISSVTTEFKCINCNSGFVEEIVADQPDNNTNNDGFSIYEATNDPSGENILNLIQEISLIANSPANLSTVRFGRLLNNFMSSQGNGGQFVRLFHGNPDDYVFSTEGLDTVITQLLNQIDSSGPPPMSQEQMDNLNEVTINNEHVNTNLQCSICMEDFVLDEKVKELECGHLYHKDCIIEWLKLHATCAICRTVFENKNSNASSTSRQQESSNTRASSSTTTTTTTSSNSNNHKPTDYDFADDLD